MYLPRHFREDRIPVLHDLLRQQSLATLVTLGPDGLIANHLPMLLHPEPAPLGTLRCHVSRANAQWCTTNTAVPALAIFTGPQHYISPTWYPTTYETGKVVPTWNYVVVQASGPLQIFDDVDWLRAHVTELTNLHEAGVPEPWRVEDAPADYIASMLKGIVGIEMRIAALEGKWKVNQNRTPAERAGVITALEALDTPESAAMARLVPAPHTILP